MDEKENMQQPAPQTEGQAPGTPTPEPTQPSQTPPIPPQPQKQSSGIGPLIAIVVILLVIIAGGLYFWLGSQQNPSLEGVMENDQTEATQQETSASLESEFNTDEFSDVESDFESIDAEFEGETSTQ